MSNPNSNTGNTNASTTKNGGKSTPMTAAAASKIQATQATGGKDMSSGGFAARAQRAGDKYEAGQTAAGEKKK